jgi:hypothetical protein
MNTFEQTLVDDGLPTGEHEDKTTSKIDVDTRSFQFPFFDNEKQLDLSGSNVYPHEKIFHSPPSANRSRKSKESSTAISFPSDFGMELSPIAKSRESDASQERIEIRSDNVENDKGRWKAQVETELDHAIVSSAHPVSASENSIVEVLFYTSETSNKSVLDDLQSARKQVGESSNNFIDKIRNAAHKRKVAVTRSRDSLVAKEEEQLRSIAESKARSQSLLGSNKTFPENDTENIRPNNGIRSAHILKNPFRNKCKRSTDGGFGGVGVPKVKKRPTTTPFSPLLGSRRKEKVIVKALQNPKKSTSAESSRTAIPRTSTTIRGEQGNVISSKNEGKPSRLRSSSLVSEGVKASTLTVDNSVLSASSFTARPLPASTDRERNAGQVGVPKVPKRIVTVPVSPCLGPKRLSRTATGKSKYLGGGLEIIGVSKAALESSSRVSTESSRFAQNMRKSSSTSTAESSELLGLNLLDVTPEKKCGHNVPIKQQNLTPQNTVVKAFEPRSTCRANKRAEYDAIRDENRQQRLQAEQQTRQEQIRRIHKELVEMSKALT